LVVASVLNALTTRTSVNTLIRVATSRGEVILHHGRLTPGQLRTQLSRLFSAFEAAKRAVLVPSDKVDRIAQLERLRDLRATGMLTDEEFEAARAQYARQLVDG
jgi:hypothetical protein